MQEFARARSLASVFPALTSRSRDNIALQRRKSVRNGYTKRNACRNITRGAINIQFSRSYWSRVFPRARRLRVFLSCCVAQ